MRVLLIDGDILTHKAAVVSSTVVDWGDGSVHWDTNVAHAGEWVRGHLRQLRARLGARDVVVAFGDPGRDYFRKDVYPAYKAGRRGKLKAPGYKAIEALIAENLPHVYLPRLEGDDVLGILATSPARAGMDQVVVSIDKDMLQVPGAHYNPDRDEEVRVTPEEADRFHLRQTLTGDRTDGYPGCPGVGPKKAELYLDDGWAGVVAAFEAHGLTEAHAVQQARVARILRESDFDRGTRKPILWSPSRVGT